MPKERILVVDDEEDILELVRFNLVKEGYYVTGALTGEDALRKTRAEKFDLIVLDLMLPGIDGLEVTKKLKSHEKAQHIPIVMLSAKVEEADIVTGLELGADDYITKPFSPRVLIARVRTALRRKVGKAEDDTAVVQTRIGNSSRPLQKGQDTYGVIRVSLPTTSIYRELQSIQIKIALGGLLIALIAAGISLLISRRISRPIEEMKKGADRFAGGDLSHRLTAPDSEELASLAEALNQMAAQLDRRIKTIVSQRNELVTVLTSMLEGVIAVDTEERIINMNMAAAEFFNAIPEKCQGRNLNEVIRNLALQQFVRQSISSKVPKKDDINMFHNGEKTLNLQSSPLLDANKEHIGTLVVFNDVTHFRHLENMQRDFVANVSHEIKTPLTAIKGFVETTLNLRS